MDTIERTLKSNDKFFPRVDINDKQRYDYYHYKNHDFAYDKKDAILIDLFKDDDEIELLDKDAPWRELDGVGLSKDNWNNLETRNEYLDMYLDDLKAEADELAAAFIRDELPNYMEDVQEDKTYIVSCIILDADDNYQHLSNKVEAKSAEDAINQLKATLSIKQLKRARDFSAYLYEAINEDVEDDPRWKVTFYLPYYDNGFEDADDMSRFSVTVQASSVEEARKFAEQYIRGRSRTVNGIAWSTATIESIEQEG